MLNKQEAAMKRERALAYAFSHQVVCVLFTTVRYSYVCMITVVCEGTWVDHLCEDVLSY